MAVEDGYDLPMMTPAGGGEEVLKPKAQWSPQEFEASRWNRKAMHAILCAMDENQYKMEEDECFNDFKIKLMDIINQSHQLGDPYSDKRVKQKIMRSLPDRLESKVTTLEENSGYKDMTMSVGIALKASKDENEEKNDSDEDLTLFVKRLKKFVKFEKKGVGSKGQDLKKNGSFNKFKPRQKDTERIKVQCYECDGIGHFALECANRMDKKKGKAMAATWSGSSD
ncbi:hypothetical protein LWI28_019973 [Acer negundo]|uniref:CCHC-type domain-containing protein n=1 Tax=Acer negundo TaxID=4023 RepID=A0AAD5IQU1_ACENE|nr:hypothetical protein LWI28_019973 [Acer negundo]